MGNDKIPSGQELVIANMYLWVPVATYHDPLWKEIETQWRKKPAVYSYLEREIVTVPIAMGTTTHVSNLMQSKQPILVMVALVRDEALEGSKTG